MALFSTVPAHAQATKGAIAARVTDSSGAVLQGAQIQLQSRDEKFASNTQGEFLIPDLAPGDYKVEVSYVGVSNLEINVNVTAGETAHIDAKLTVSSANQQVIVTGERPRAEDEAINR